MQQDVRREDKMLLSFLLPSCDQHTPYEARWREVSVVGGPSGCVGGVEGEYLIRLCLKQQQQQIALAPSLYLY